MQFRTGGNIAVTFDENNGGVITIGGGMTGAYGIELNGRGTLNLHNPVTGGTTVWLLYAVAPNRAAIMDISDAAVSVGEVIPQTETSPFSNSDLLGTYTLGSGELIIRSTPIFAGFANFDGGSSIGGAGSMTGLHDASQITALSPDQAFSGTYSISAISNNGRGTLLLPAQNRSIAIWVASQSESVGLWIDAASSQPSILHFSQ
jgi:hypothetical protein